MIGTDQTCSNSTAADAQAPELMIRLSGVGKVYRLGEIGSGSLRRDLQSWYARKRGRPDPNSVIGRETLRSGEEFYALRDIDLSVYRGECLGIIGGNGAGKSTLLKLISRVTSPSFGEIDLYGRVTSMLEVGTGFHPEMTGRENVYLNGAILGMSRKEIDSVLEEIIDFSEVREFIDTPVKRYSSGMYVKLAFSVAAHLQSEIVIMDEVLAVGDLAFQKKCIQKMLRAVREENRTILYVSHNMNTIRDLCSRCVVLHQGRMVYDGDVEEAISYYSRFLLDQTDLHQDFSAHVRRNPDLTGICTVAGVSMKEKEIRMGDPVSFSVSYRSSEARSGIVLRMMVVTPSGAVTGMTFSDPVTVSEGETVVRYSFDTSPLAAGIYSCDFAVCEYEDNVERRHDFVGKAMSFSIEENQRFFGRHWESRAWGSVKLAPVRVVQGDEDGC